MMIFGSEYRYNSRLRVSHFQKNIQLSQFLRVISGITLDFLPEIEYNIH